MTDNTRTRTYRLHIGAEFKFKTMGFDFIHIIKITDIAIVADRSTVETKVYAVVDDMSFCKTPQEWVITLTSLNAEQTA